jgi:hypothetical protein
MRPTVKERPSQQMNGADEIALAKPEQSNSLPATKKAHHRAFLIPPTCDNHNDLGDSDRYLGGASRPKRRRQRHSAGRRSTKPSGLAIASGNMLLARMARPRCSGVATTFLSALE